jgi:hypothetical protein
VPLLLGALWSLLRASRFAKSRFARTFAFSAAGPQQQGALKKKKMKRGYIWQIANKSGMYLSVFFVFVVLKIMAFLCVSQQGEFKNTIKNLLGKVYVKNFWPKKLRKQNFFPFVFSHRFFFIAFLAVSLHEEPKNTIKIFSKIIPENPKKSQKKVGR